MLFNERHTLSKALKEALSDISVTLKVFAVSTVHDLLADDTVSKS